MANIVEVTEALESLYDYNFTVCSLSGEEINTEAEFDECVKYVTGSNSKNEAIYGDKPSEITWERVSAEIERRVYFSQRYVAYPLIRDQLDMQYHDAVDGTTTWQDAVQAVKDAHPKPE